MLVSFGPFAFDRQRRLLRRGDAELPLPPRVLGVLELLVTRAGDIVPRQELLDSVWREAFVTDTSLAEAVSFLRQALGDDPAAPTYIQTVHRRGYRFVAPVTGPAAPLPPGPAPEDRPAEEITRSADRDITRLPDHPMAGPVSPSIGRELVPWGAALIFAILAAAAVWRLTDLQAPVPPIVQLELNPTSGTSFDTRAPALALSPDATQVVWSACDNSECRLFIRPVNRLEASPLAGTEGASAPFFSPDGRSVGFFARGKLKKVALAGGAPVTLTDAAQAYGAAWLPDGRIVFAASAFGGLMRVSDRGGEAAVMTTPSAGAGELGHAWPASSPDGQSVFMTVSTSPLDGAPGRIAVLPLDRGEGRVAWQTVIDAADMARPVSRDYVAFSKGGELQAVAFDRTRLVTAGAGQVVATGIGRAQFAVAGNGALVYAGAGAQTPASLQWSPPGSPPLAPDLQSLQSPTLSPDGRQLAGVGGSDQSSSDIWVADIERGAMTRLTHGGINAAPAWRADGGLLFYAAATGGPFEIWSRDPSAATPAQRIVRASRPQRHVFPSSVSQRFLVYSETGGSGKSDVWVTPLDGGPAVPIVQTPFDDAGGVLTADGRLLAYQSDESGRWEIYLVRMADKRRVGVSAGGGTRPFWSADGRTLLYHNDGAVMSVAVNAEGDRMPAPVMLWTAASHVAGVAPDGRLLVRRASTHPSTHAVLTLEWVREIRHLLGPPASALPR